MAFKKIVPLENNINQWQRKTTVTNSSTEHDIIAFTILHLLIHWHHEILTHATRERPSITFNWTTYNLHTEFLIYFPSFILWQSTQIGSFLKKKISSIFSYICKRFFFSSSFCALYYSSWYKFYFYFYSLEKEMVFI